MESILSQKESQLEALAHEFSTHPDFAQARADALLWDNSIEEGIRAVHGVCSRLKRRQPGLV